MTTRFINPIPQYWYQGEVVTSGELTFYESGTTDLKNIYKDINQKIDSANPVTLKPDGRVPNIFYSGTARVILKTAQGQQVFDVDDIGIVSADVAFSAWGGAVEYGQGDIVEAVDGNYYRSLQNNNTNNDPVSSPTFWEKIEFLDTWNPNISYSQDDIVLQGGILYRSTVDSNLNNSPDTSPDEWTLPVALTPQSQFEQTVNDIGNVSAATNIDYSVSQIHKATMTGAAAFTFTNPPPSGILGYIWLQLIDGDTNAPDFETNNTIEWSEATLPTPTAKDVWLFETIDGGATWLGSKRAFG